MSVLELVAAAARRAPHTPAVRDAHRQLSYAELWECSGRAAARLRAAGARADSVVGICGGRTVELVAGLVGILRSGAAYLPLDASYPADRLTFMLEQTEARILVGQPEQFQRLPDTGQRRIELDALLAEGASAQDMPWPAPHHLCYVMFTSGSTGEPKGVMLEHRSLENLIRWQVADSTCRAGARTLQFAPISFDVSFQEIFATLAAGGTLVCADEADRQDPERLWDLLRRERVSRMFVPFVALQALTLYADAPDDAPPLDEVITAGEQLQCSEPLKELFAALPRCRLVNQYGPTETHVVTRFRLPQDPSTWPLLPPIGRAVAGHRVHLRDGELYVSGPGVARGYWGRADLTAERFLPAPDGSGRMYRTGDLVETGDGGELAFIGRADAQLKVRGHRIEPAEVESALAEHPGVVEAAVAAVGASAVEKRLVAFVVARGDELPRDLRRHVSGRLPPHMVPSRYVRTERLPRTPSGKLDRQALCDAGQAAGPAGPPAPRG